MLMRDMLTENVAAPIQGISLSFGCSVNQIWWCDSEIKWQFQLWWYQRTNSNLINKIWIVGSISSCCYGMLASEFSLVQIEDGTIGW